MLYKLILSIGSLIILFFLSTTYLTSIKKLENINYRQKIYKMSIIIAFFAIGMDILEGVFFSQKLDILFKIAWYSHWLSTYGFYFIVFYYFMIYFGLENPKNWKEVFFDKKILTLKNIYSIFIITVFIAVLLIVKPLALTDKFEFVPFRYGIFILVTMVFYAIFLVAIIVKYLKTTDENKKAKILSMLVVIGGVSISAIIQIIISTFGFLGLGLYLATMLMYFLIENVDLIIADELIIGKI